LERKNHHGAWRSWSRCIDYNTLSSGALLRSDDVLDRGMLASPSHVAEARIEHASVTRTEGWKQRTLRRVHPREIALAERDAPPGP
jgi:hypothetical protein